AVSQLVAERGGVDLMPELGYHPTNKYLPPRAHTTRAASVPAPALEAVRAEGGFLGWVDRMLSN
ncbi:MAG: ferredoxin, partial [Mesorhizobium sp.]